MRTPNEQNQRTGHALMMALTMFEQGQRQTGRTTNMVASVPNGSLILINDDRHYGRYRKELRERRIRLAKYDHKDPTRIRRDGERFPAVVIAHEVVEQRWREWLGRFTAQFVDIENELNLMLAERPEDIIRDPKLTVDQKREWFGLPPLDQIKETK